MKISATVNNLLKQATLSSARSTSRCPDCGNYLTLPGRLTRSARRQTLHLPARWPWHRTLDHALARLRRLPTTA